LFLVCKPDLKRAALSPTLEALLEDHGMGILAQLAHRRGASELPITGEAAAQGEGAVAVGDQRWSD
jgi:hypothetical protein